MHVLLSKWRFQYSCKRIVMNCSPIVIATTTATITHSLFNLVCARLVIKACSVTEVPVNLQ